MKIGTITAAFPCKNNKFNIDFSAIQESGFEYVDYSEFADARNNIYKLDHEEFVSYMKEIDLAFKHHGLIVNQLHMAWPTDDSSPTSIKESVKLYERAIEGASYIGCKYAVLHQRVPFGWNSDGGQPEEMYRINKEFILNLLPTATKYGVTICLENLPWNVSIFPVEEVVKFVKDINNNNFGMCYDTGHANMLKCNPYDDVMLMKDVLKVLHCHDNDGNNDLHQLPRTGTFKWNEFVSALKDIGFNGVFSLETLVPLTLEKAELARQRKELYKLVEDITK